MSTGGFADANGVSRSTVDIDATVSAQAVEPERLAAALAHQDILPRIEGALEFARSRHIFLAEHRPSGVPVDISLAWLPFEEEAIAAAEERDFAGVRTRVARPADLVIYKMVAARPRDLDDIENLLAVHGRTMDLRRIRFVPSSPISPPCSRTRRGPQSSNGCCSRLVSAEGAPHRDTTEDQAQWQGPEDAGQRGLEAGAGALGQACAPASLRVRPHGFGFKPGVDLDRMNQLVDELDADETAPKLGR